jgi:hypothetical protein
MKQCYFVVFKLKKDSWTRNKSFQFEPSHDIEKHLTDIKTLINKPFFDPHMFMGEKEQAQDDVTILFFHTWNQ